jgi:transposase
MQEMNIRSYASEPDRGRRNWKEKAEAKQYMPIVEDAGEKRGRRLVRARGELIERTFAHAYETGAMRRTHLRHHNNILKRLLVHIAGFNLALTMRKLYGVGKPRRLQGLFLSIWGWIGLMLIGLGWHRRDPNDSKTNFATRTGLLLAARANKSKMGFATGC